MVCSPAPQDGQLSLSGTVTNSLTGEPVPRALVEMTHYETPSAVAPGQRLRRPRPLVVRTFSDPSGGFTFTGLAPGEYTAVAQKPQFTVAGSSTVVQLTASTSDIRIKLAPLGVITGKVVDQDGQPVWGVSVVADSVNVIDGFRQTTAARTVTTDERGMFRLWNLRPDGYYLKAAGRSGSTYSYVGDNTPQYFADQAFQPAYHGGGSTLDAATPLEIKAGTEAHADLKVHMEPAYAIRGVLSNYVPHRAVKFELLKDGESIPASPASVNSATGRFEIQGVVSGAYLLHATQDEATADVAINLSGRDLDGLSATFFPPADLNVHTTIANPETNPSPDADSNVGGRLGMVQCILTLDPADGRSNSRILMSQQDQNGGLAIHGVTGGVYRSAISCFGGYAQSALLGTQDLLLNPTLKVNAGGELPAVEILVRRGGGSITGQLKAVKPEDSDGLTVLAVPQFAGSTGPVRMPVFNGAQSERENQFGLGNLAPGAYEIYAFAGRKEVEFRNPKFLQTLTGGTRVQVNDSSTATIAITEVIR